MTIWRGLHGHGKVWMGRWSKRPWRWRRSARILRIGEKNGSKRSLLVDGNGIPLSLVVSGAERHDMKLLEPTLDRIVVKRPKAGKTEKHNLCADKGYAGEPARRAIEKRDY